MLKITIEDDQGKREEKSLDFTDIIIGRDSDCQLRLNDRNVSRQHAHLFQKGDAVFLEDLNSYNGLYVNGDRVVGCKKLGARDIIGIGDFQLEISGPGIATLEESTERFGAVDDSDAETLPGVYPSEDTDTDQTVPDGELSDYAQDETAHPKMPGGSIRQPLRQPLPAKPAPQPQQQQRNLAETLRNVKEDPVEEGPRHEPTALIRLDQIDLDSYGSGAGQIQSDKQPKLLCVSTDLAGKEYFLQKTENTIGRIEEGNDLQMDHRSISKHHAKIVIDGNRYRIIDLKSANGTLVNGEEYAQTTLHMGDLIELGHVKLRFITPGRSYQPTPEEAEAINLARNPGKAKAQHAKSIDAMPEAEYNRHDTKIESESKSVTTVIVVFGSLMFIVLLALIAIILKVTGVLGGGDNLIAQNQPVVQQPAAPVRSPEAVSLFQKAVNAYNGKRFQEASALVDATLTISPDYIEAIELKGKLAVDGKAEELLSSANKAIAAKRYEEANRMLSEVPENAVRYDEVRQLKARIQSSYIDDLYERGIKALENNDIVRSKEVANKIGSIDPNAPQLGELRDQIALVQERNEEKRVAVAHETEAAAAPKTTAKNEPAKKQTKVDPVAAKPAPKPEPAKPAPKAEPAKPAPGPAPAAGGGTSPRDLYSQASKQVMANDFGNAIKTFNTCIQTDSKFCQCYRGLGIAYAKYRQPQNAVKNYKRYLSCNPNAPDAAQVTKIIQQYESN